VETKLTRIAQIAKEKPKEKITSLAGLLNKEKNPVWTEEPGA